MTLQELQNLIFEMKMCNTRGQYDEQFEELFQQVAKDRDLSTLEGDEETFILFLVDAAVEVFSPTVWEPRWKELMKKVSTS